jgi:ABC-type sugar transport system substrate-binding protein
MRDSLKLTLMSAAFAAVAVFGMAGTAAAKDEKLVLIEHSPDSETFWNTVKNAATLAAKETGATVTFRNPPTGDLADMARIIQQTVAEAPDGIIRKVPPTDAPHLRRCIAAGCRRFSAWGSGVATASLKWAWARASMHRCIPATVR